MSAVATGLMTPWGDRRYLIPKEMAYALSVTFKARLDGLYFTVRGERAGRDQRPAFGHLFGDASVIVPEGARYDLPTGDVTAGGGRIGAPDDPNSAALQLRLELALSRTENLLLDCQGVVDFRGGIRAFRTLPAGSVTGSAFIATRNETDSARYRWLNRRQLFGVGRVAGIEQSTPRELELTFDLYASG